MSLLPLESGVWQAELDSQGLAILMADRALQGNAINAKKNWFSEDQLRLRQDREVLSAHPVDRLIEAGLYRRAFNPQAGKRPTSRRRYSTRQDPWRQDVYESTGWAQGVFLPCYGRDPGLVEGGEHYTWDIMWPRRVTLNPPARAGTIEAMTDAQHPTDHDEDFEETLMRLLTSFTGCYSPEELAGLPEHAVILTEPQGAAGGPERLCKTAGGWHRFTRDGHGQLAVGEAATPTVPALVVLDGVEEHLTRAPRRAARSTDPASSHHAVRRHAPKWDSMNMRALRLFADHHDPDGLSYHRIERLAAQRWGGGALGKSPWKRCSELHTDFDPPLIERARDEAGRERSVPGEFGDPVDAFVITAAGRAMVARTSPDAERVIP